MLQASSVRTINPFSIIKLADGVSLIGGLLIFSAFVWFVYSINHAAIPSPGAMRHELSCLWDLRGTFSIAPGLERRCDSIGYSTVPLWIGIASVFSGALLRYANVKSGQSVIKFAAWKVRPDANSVAPPFALLAETGAPTGKEGRESNHRARETLTPVKSLRRRL